LEKDGFFFLIVNTISLLALLNNLPVISSSGGGKWAVAALIATLSAL
jgi:hypothetical protein